MLRRSTATLAQKKGSVKDIQAHLRHAKADTTANEYMQELPDSVKQMVDSVYGELSRTEARCGLRLFATKCYQTGKSDGGKRQFATKCYQAEEGVTCK